LHQPLSRFHRKAVCSNVPVMALIRILVDGDCLLHQWLNQASEKPRFSVSARDELSCQLALYQDISGTPITVVFDGGAPEEGMPRHCATTKLEVLYSPAGQSADDVIERAAVCLAKYGDVMAVTDSPSQRDTVISMGGKVFSCSDFIMTVAKALKGRDGAKQIWSGLSQKHVAETLTRNHAA